ncbi:MAG TPA: hypothetical protein VMZ69_04415 [Saprospiraceae bacterium]|nr:hypothetical protein [Saprospiraceae bacterium]
MKKFWLIPIASLLSSPFFAQHVTYLGIEIGAANDRFEYFDEGDQLVTTPLANIRWGIIAGHTFNNSLSIEAGVIRKNYKEGFGFNFNSFESSHTSTSIRTWQFPLRLKPKLRLFSDDVFFRPAVGFNYCINRDNAFHSGGGGSVGTVEEAVTYHYDVDYGLTRSFMLVETSLGIEVELFERAAISFSASYFTGFKPVIDLDLTYQINDGPDTIVKAHSKGEYVSFYIGMSYPLNFR